MPVERKPLFRAEIVAPRAAALASGRGGGRGRGPGGGGLENRLHYVRDWSFDEDRCAIRSGSLPWVMATLRNFAIGLLRCSGYSNIAAALRECAALPHRAVALLGR